MAEITFSKGLAPSDPEQRPCTIVGKPENLKKVPFAAVSALLAPRVTEQVKHTM